jgi:AcrR family transcriptional regulator
MEQDKASRILDAAEALLIAYGYRKVTIDEVATRARVGKGTVYLYWPSKQELFAAVIARDAGRRGAEQLAALTADPAEVQLHRLMRRVFLQVMRQPLAKALATGDYATLGEVLTSKTGSQFTFGKVDTTANYLAILHKHGLLADDPTADPTLLYRLSAVVVGSFVLESGPAGGDIDLEDKADALATTVRRAFEPATVPKPAVLRTAAKELARDSRQWLSDLTDTLPETTHLVERT